MGKPGSQIKASRLPFQRGDRVRLNGKVEAVVLKCTHNALTLRFVGNLSQVEPGETPSEVPKG